MIDTSHDWFAPRYRRVGIVLVCFLWMVLEAFGGERLWQIISFAVFAYATWSLLLKYREPGASKKPPRD